MNEDLKINEAEYLLRSLKQARADEIRYVLSAFLSAARSALQYALEEAKTKPNGQAWYDNEVKADPLTKFLKDTRDVNIHDRPIPVTVSATMRATVSASVSVSAVIISGKTGERTEVPASLPQSPPVAEQVGAADQRRATVDAYSLTGWAGNESVLPLCERYLAEIRRIVGNGRALGFLS